MLGRLADEVARNPVLAAALSRTFEVRDRAAQAQEAAMSALNIPSAADVDRLTRRLRSLSQRLEGIEDAVDRLDVRLESLAAATVDSDAAAHLEARLDAIARDVAAVRKAVGAAESPPRAEEAVGVADS